jgi:4-aminobutyrate aminotransferase
MGHLSSLLKQAIDIEVVRGEGVYVFDRAGRRYLDFTAGIGVTSTGHCHPAVVEAAQRQAATIIHAQFTTVRHPGVLELSDRLVEVMPAGLDSVFFANSGAEAVEAALRLARHATGRPGVVVFQGGFHGRTVAAASMTTSRTTFRAGLEPLMGGVYVAPFPYSYRYGWDEPTTTRFCLRELDYLFATLCAPEDTAAIMVEPVLGEGGYVPANAEFFAGLRERCDRYGIMLVVDEIQAGVGRTGRFWGHQHFGVQPDIVITAKGLASGFPLSAIAAPAALMGRGRPGSQGGTYGGNAVACAASLATLRVIEEEGLVARAAELGGWLRDRLGELARVTPQIGEVRGLGLMLGVEFSAPDGAPDPASAHQIQQEAAHAGLLLLTCGTYGNVIRWVPALVVSRDQLQEGLDIFAAAVHKVCAS